MKYLISHTEAQACDRVVQWYMNVDEVKLFKFKCLLYLTKKQKHKMENWDSENVRKLRGEEKSSMNDDRPSA